MADGGYADYICKHPVAKMDAPSPAVLTQWAKGAPNGLVSPQGKRKESISIRNYNVTPQLPANGLTVTELFCGGGLMAVGLKAAGYNLTFANDFDKRAAQAYAHNIGDHVVCGDITSAEIQAQIPNADIIAGGPPCQDYSVAGSGAGEDGERGRLVWTYLGIIADKQPKAFVFENVKGLITKRHRPTFDALLAEFDRIGYAVTWRIINAWDYGVAQKRERVFIVGIRKDLGFTFDFLEPSTDEYRTQVLRDVIGDLPEPNDTVGQSVKKPEHSVDISEPSPSITTQYRCQSVEITNHVEYPITDAQFSHAKAHLQGYNDSPEKPARIVRAKVENFADFPQDRPRRFTVRECLRIQSVPDWYVLPSDISLSAQYRIVGNGVASRVAYKIGVALAEQLNAALAARAQSERRAA